MSEAYYIGVAIAYTNGPPHIGHALEFVQADCFARYSRLCGKDTRLQLGTDEYGSKMYKTAQELGVDTQELVDKNAARFLEMCSKLNCTQDNFFRSTEPYHRTGVQKLWQVLEAAGDIYKDEYEGLYCVGCEAYLNEKDLVDGLCPNHKKAPELLKEENYFFRLSKYNEQIRDLINSGQLKIYPDARRNEFLALLDKGLQDISFSRPKSVLPWGVEVPGDPDHVMYVWCDALSNYITGLGYGSQDETLFTKYWPASMQIIGKDILRFHAGIWIAMQLSAGLPISKAIGVHGFITSEGQKMSKSLGNVVDPFEVAAEFGTDALRYYLLREVPTTDDGDFSRDRFLELYNSELANKLGNLVSRTSAMLHKYNEGKVSNLNLTGPCQQELELTWSKYHEHFANYDFKKAVEAIVRLLEFANKYIEDNKPWELAKNNTEAAVSILTELIEIIRQASLLLTPYIPETASKIQLQLGYQPTGIFAEDRQNSLNPDHEVGRGDSLFPRLDAESLS